MTTPLTLPTLGPSKQRFDILRFDASAPEASGALGGIQIAMPRWELRLTLGDGMSRATSDDWVGLLSRLRGNQGRVFGFDYKRRLPARYPSGFGGLDRAGGGAFDGTATDWSLTGSRDELTLEGLPVGLTLSVGDLGMFVWTTGGEARRHVVRFVEKGAADGSGDLALAIEPPLPGLVPTDAVFDLVEPCCIMVVVEKAVADEDRRGKIGGTTLRLLQDLRP